MKHQLAPIGYVESCFKEKFGIPRQPGLVTEARATLHFYSPYDDPAAFEGLESFSHLWLFFLFHLNRDNHWRPQVRPPRFGGNEKCGVFATRSPYHPNGIGLSVVEIIGIENKNSRCSIHVKSADLVDGTPIIDIKPYLPYVDAKPNAISSFAPEAPQRKVPVRFSEKALQKCAEKSILLQGDVRLLIEQLLSMDPRPAYKQGKAEEKIYGLRLFDFDIKWQALGGEMLVLEIENCSS